MCSRGYPGIQSGGDLGIYDGGAGLGIFSGRYPSISSGGYRG